MKHSKRPALKIVTTKTKSSKIKSIAKILGISVSVAAIIYGIVIFNKKSKQTNLDVLTKKDAVVQTSDSPINLSCKKDIICKPKKTFKNLFKKFKK